MPTLDRRVRLPYAKALLVLLRSVLVEREPLYRQGETVHGFCPAAFGLKAGEAVSDDAIGQGLDRLFDADRAGLLTAVIVAAAEALRSAPVGATSRHDIDFLLRPTPPGARPCDTRPARAPHHLRLVEGPPTRPQAAPVGADHHG